MKKVKEEKEKKKTYNDQHNLFCMNPNNSNSNQTHLENITTMLAIILPCNNYL